MQENNNYEKLLRFAIKYTLMYAYENKVKFALLEPSELLELENPIYNNLNELKDHHLEEFI